MAMAMHKRISSSLNVLFVGALPPHPGGAAISAGQILTGLATRGSRVRAIAPVTAESRTSASTFDHAHKNMVVTRFHVPHYFVGPAIPAEATYRDVDERGARLALVESLSREQPDLVFVGRELYAAVVHETLSQYTVPFVLRLPGQTTHGLVRGHYPSELRERLFAAYRRAALIISPSSELAALMNERGMKHVVVIPTAVDLKSFAPRPKSLALLAQLGIPPTDIIIVHASNLKPAKRPIDLVRTASDLVRQCPHVMFLIIGDGPLRESLEIATRDEGVRDRFRFAGWVDYREMPDYLNLADIVVMPSDIEGLARLYVEAQACGKALVASDIPAAREVITDNHSGLLFPVGDCLAMSRQLRNLVSDKQQRTLLGSEARRVAAHHSLDIAVRKYEKVLSNLVCRHRMHTISSVGQRPAKTHNYRS